LEVVGRKGRRKRKRKRAIENRSSNDGKDEAPGTRTEAWRTRRKLKRRRRACLSRKDARWHKDSLCTLDYLGMQNVRLPNQRRHQSVPFGAIQRYSHTVGKVEL